jgi:TatD DNase family protein
MKFVDAHIHLSDPEYSGKTQETVETAKRAGVVAVVSNSMNLETSRQSLKLAEEHDGLVYAALGIHPWNTNQLAPNEIEQTVDFILQNGTNKKRVVAIGEVGLDPQYAKRREQKELQAKVFHEMLRLAEKLKLPAIVHSRWSAPKILEILPSYKKVAVLWHWFSSPTDMLPKIIERGDYVSEGPPTVFSSRIQEVVRIVPLENLLTETDGPVRFFGPFKDKFTTPAFIPEVVKAIAEIKEKKEDTVAEQVLHNFANLFKVNSHA